MPAAIAVPVEIKQAELSDVETILEFLRAAGEPRKSDPTFWRWHFLEYPGADPHDIPVWIAKCGGHMVGQFTAIPAQLKVGADTVRVHCVTHIGVGTEHRGRGLAKRLIEKVMESCPTMFALGWNDASRPLFKGFGFRPLGHVHRYQRLLFPGNAPELAGRRLVSRLANICYAPFRPKIAPMGAAQVDGVVVEANGFDASLNALWQEACRQRPCAVVRSSQFLQWQFRNQPDKRYLILTLREAGQLVGYTVLFFRKAERGDAPPKASIADMLYGPRDPAGIIGKLVDATIRLAMDRRAGSLVIDVLDQHVEEQLVRRGFFRARTAAEFMAFSRDHPDLVYEARNWFLTRADGDASIFESPNL